MVRSIPTFSNPFDFLKAQGSLPFAARCAIRFAVKVTIRNIAKDTTVSTQDLSDHILKDAGLTRDMIRSVDMHPFVHPRF